MPRKYTSPAAQERKVAREETRLIVRTTLITILRRSTIVDTDNPEFMAACSREQEKIAKQIERTLPR